MTLGKNLRTPSLLIENRHPRPHWQLQYMTPYFDQCLKYVSTCVIDGHISWAVLPRQRILKGIAHVEQAPCDNNIVVKSHVKTDLEENKAFMNYLLTKFSIFTHSYL